MLWGDEDDNLPVIPDLNMENLVENLQNSVSNDQNELTSAQAFFEQASQNNLPEFIRSLSEVLGDVGHSPAVRMASGIQFKALIMADDNMVQKQLAERWINIDHDVRSQVKNNVLQALGTEISAAQCVAYIGIIELADGQWLEVIPTLVNNVKQVVVAEQVKVASLEAIGGMSHDVEFTDEAFSPYQESIVDAILQSILKEQPSDRVRVAALNAFCNYLPHASAGFEKETERYYIMNVVFKATQITDTQVKVAALQCLVKIMSLYYQHISEYYMKQALTITIKAMESEVDEVSLNGIEFWLSVCDEEVDLASKASEAAEVGQPPKRTSRFYAKGALQYLVPLMKKTVTKQEFNINESGRNPRTATTQLLERLSKCCADVIIDAVEPFIRAYIGHQEARYRNGALTMLVCITKGPHKPDGLFPLAKMVYKKLLEIGFFADNMVSRSIAGLAYRQITAMYNQNLTEALLFLMEIHKRVVAPSIITARTRVVLADFNMSCDETGKLILKPRPANMRDEINPISLSCGTQM